MKRRSKKTSPAIFLGLPQDGALVIDHITVAGPHKLFLDVNTEGYAEETVRDYAAGTSGLELKAIGQATQGRHDVAVRIEGDSRDGTSAVTEVLVGGDVRLVGILGREGAEVLEFRTPDPGLITDTRDQLAGAVGSCTLVSKRHAASVERTRSDCFGADLTDRQREVSETAVRGDIITRPRRERDGVGRSVRSLFLDASSTLPSGRIEGSRPVLRSVASGEPVQISRARVINTDISGTLSICCTFV